MEGLAHCAAAVSPLLRARGKFDDAVGRASIVHHSVTFSSRYNVSLDVWRMHACVKKREKGGWGLVVFADYNSTLSSQQLQLRASNRPAMTYNSGHVRAASAGSVSVKPL